MIKITNKYRPFTHLPGMDVLIPKSLWKVKVYPTKLIFSHMEKELSIPLDVHLEGPFKDFTVMQDLEKDRLRVFGFSASGYFSYLIYAKDNQHVLLLERGPKEGISFGVKLLLPKEQIAFPDQDQMTMDREMERLSFGNHKKQDVELINRRKDLSEILPIWYLLGQKFPSQNESTLDLTKNRVEIEQALMNLFNAGFEGIFVPRTSDDHHLGLTVPKDSALGLLTKSTALIRSLFIQEGDQVSVLPCLPVSLHAGRFTNIQLEKAALDLEWSKKKLKKMVIRPKQDAEIRFQFPPGIKSFRVNRKQVQDANSPVTLEQSKVYLLDKFS